MAASGLNTIINKSPSLESANGGWWDDAVCKDWDFKKHGDPFFPVSKAEVDAMPARKICRGCPVVDSCLYDSLEKNSTVGHGIFGGATPEERLRIKRRNYKAVSRAKKRNEADAA